MPGIENSFHMQACVKKTYFYHLEKAFQDLHLKKDPAAYELTNAQLTPKSAPTRHQSAPGVEEWDSDHCPKARIHWCDLWRRP